jgi:hypothetical protein
MQTFIVRVWMPADGQVPPESRLHGKVSHVESGRTSSFSGSDELLACLTAHQPEGAGAGESR